jgi:hypothetical protein
MPGGPYVNLCRQIVVFASFSQLLLFSVFSQTLEVQPGSITVPSPDFTADARVVLKNSSGETLRRLSIDQFSNDGIKAEPQRLTAKTVFAKTRWSGPSRSLCREERIFQDP